MLKGQKHSIESRRKISIAHMNKKCSLETRRKMSKIHKGMKRSPSSCRRISLSKRGKNHPLFGKHHSIKTRRKMSLGRRGTNHPMFGKKQSLKARKKMSIAKKILWKNPEYRNITLKRLLSGGSRFPNTFEARVLLYLNKKYPGRFQYCGKGQYLVNGRSPDFIDNKRKIVVLAHGVYWHCCPRIYKANYYNRRLKKTAQQIWKEDKGAVKLFRKAGYKVKIIWEDRI
jgi:hypothetical protein